TVLDADRHQQPRLPDGVLGEGRMPLCRREYRRQIALRQYRDRPLGLLDGLGHLLDEVAARPEVPGLQQRGVPVLLQGVGDPFGPGDIGAGVADEEVSRLAHPRPPVAVRDGCGACPTTSPSARTPRTT